MLMVVAIINMYTRGIFLKEIEENRHVAHEIQHVNALAVGILQLLMPANDYLSSGNPEEREKFKILQEKIKILLDQKEENSHVEELHDILRQNIEKIENLSKKILAIEKPVGSPLGSQFMYEMDKIGSHTADIIQDFDRKQHEKLDALREKSDNDTKVIRIVMFLAWIIILVLGLAMIYFFNENFKKPLEKLSSGFHGVSHGRWNQIHINQNDEISDLAGEFNSMVERMSASYEELENAVRSRTAELSELNKRLEKLAITDGLSGLYNHRYFYERYHQEYNRAFRYNRSLAVFILDIDHFKQYNDKNGHLAGDKVIQKVGKILLKESRKSDLVARYGGEEFVVISPELDKKQALAFAERMRTGVEKVKFSNEKSQPSGRITVSIGVGIFPDINTGPENLLKKTDEAMYQAKKEGRNRTVLAGKSRKTK